jgi:hypothetical protein
MQFPGGVGVPASGAIFGDVYPKPRALFLGSVPMRAGKTVEAVLESASNTPIQILGVEGGGVKLEKASAQPANPLRIILRISPRKREENYTLASFLTLKVKSNETREIKLLYTGNVVDDHEK